VVVQSIIRHAGHTLNDLFAHSNILYCQKL
jgi:hypothetical protein